MTNRTRFLLILAGVLAIAVLLQNQCKQAAVEPPTVDLVRIVVAGSSIEPYQSIEANQVRLGPSPGVPITEAADYYTELTQVIGLMTTRFIKTGQEITREDAKPAEEVRYVEQMALEIVSFPAVFSEMVAGQVRPGHKVNIYGYRGETGRGVAAETILVAGNVWVVDVRTAAGEEAREATPEAAAGRPAGIISSPSVRGAGAEPGSVLSVAASPDIVRKIIDAFGAQGYEAWVTLAPSPDHIPTAPPPTSTPTRLPPGTPIPPNEPTPTPPLPPPSLTGAVYMSHADDGPQVDVFPNTTSMAWAIVALQYRPDQPLPIRIDVKTADGATTVFDRDEIHPQSGQVSYLINPAGGFSPDTKYTTTIYATDETFSADWQLCGNSPLPFTGEDGSAPGDN